MIKSSGINEQSHAKKLGVKKAIIYCVAFSVLTFMLSVLQTSDIRFFGQVPDMLLSLICAIGFVLGGTFGAVFGLLGGILIEILGGSGFSLTPILYVLCGYLCGALVDKFLTSNFWSFLIYGAAAGILREIFTTIYYGLISDEFSIGKLIKNVIISEYFAFFICLIPMYFTVLAIYLLFKGKDERSRIVR